MMWREFIPGPALASKQRQNSACVAWLAINRMVEALDRLRRRNRIESARGNRLARILLDYAARLSQRRWLCDAQTSAIEGTVGR